MEPTYLYLNLAVRVVAKWTSELQEVHQLTLPSGVRQIVKHILKGLESSFGRAFVRNALGLITFAAHGLSDVEIEDLLSLQDAVLLEVYHNSIPSIKRFPSHIWWELKDEISHMILDRGNGCWQWSNSEIKEAAEEYFKPEKQSLHNLMARYFGNLVKPEMRKERKVKLQEWTSCGRSPFRSEARINHRRCVEASHHMLQAGDDFVVEAIRELYNFIGICCKIKVGEGLTLIHELNFVGDIIRRIILKNIDCHSKIDKGMQWLAQEMDASTNQLIALLKDVISQSDVTLAMKDVLAALKDSKLQRFFNKMCDQFFYQTGTAVGQSPSPVVLEGHTAHINGISVSSEGRRMATASDDKTVRIWDLKSETIICALEGHSGSVTSVAYSSDGKYIVSGSKDAIVRIWDGQTASIIHELRGHSGFVTSVAFSPDGRTVASVSYDRTLRLWSFSTGDMIRTMNGHTDYVTCASYAPSGKWIVSGSWDMIVKVWDTDSGEAVNSLEGHSGAITSVAYSFDGKNIVSASEDRTVRVWDVGSSVLISRMDHPVGVKCVALSLDDRFIASGSYDKIVRIWDALSGVMVSKLEGHTHWITSVTFSAISGSFITGSLDKTVRVWKPVTYYSGY